MSVFTITLRTRDGEDGIKTLRAALKILWRRFGLKAIGIEEQLPASAKKAKRRSSKKTPRR